MDMFSFIECSNQTRSLSALFELLVNCAAEEGFNEVAYGAITYAEFSSSAGASAARSCYEFPAGVV